MLKKKTVYSSLIVVASIFFLSTFGPYNFFHHLNAENILEEPLLSKEFKDTTVKDVIYKGDDTYMIKTEEKDFVVMRKYFSVMNYKWVIFEYKKELL